MAEGISVLDVAARPRLHLRRWLSGAWRGAPRARRAPSIPRPNLGRILVVEDDAATRGVLTEALSDDGFDVAGAQDGADALRIAIISRPDAIILDLGLPVLDGQGFAAHWRERAESESVPLVVVSARTDGRTLAEAMHAAAFCRKPVDVVALSTLVRSLIVPPTAALAAT